MEIHMETQDQSPSFWPNFSCFDIIVCILKVRFERRINGYPTILQTENMKIFLKVNILVPLCASYTDNPLFLSTRILCSVSFNVKYMLVINRFYLRQLCI